MAKKLIRATLTVEFEANNAEDGIREAMGPKSPFTFLRRKLQDPNARWLFEAKEARKRKIS